ncbi:MAG TPA: signal peptidase II [Nitrospiraceae bacterium]|nr:signal peptidase II [Nitrospiraceae bacterium]
MLVSCVGCDQATKELARTTLAFEPPLSWFHDTVRLECAENTGAFLSLGTSLPEDLRFLLFQLGIGAGLLTLLIVLWRSRPDSLLYLTGWCLILGGRIGNLLDRVAHHGRGIDFINLGIGPFRTGIFNLADVYITIGALLLLFVSFRPDSRQASK